MDEREIIDLYDAQARALVGFFARRTRDPQLALDLVAETFLAAFEQRRRCRARTDGQRAAWLYRIATNELADYFRRLASERAPSLCAVCRRAAGVDRGGGRGR